jgi:hypothetical protein
MTAAVVARTETGFTIQIEVPYKGSMLEAEEAILEALNRAGVAATAEALEHLDAGGRPMVVGGAKLTSKGRLPKDCQTPTASPASAGTSTSPPAAARRPARSTATPGSSSAPPPGSPG